jgi:hypothetical protein
LACSLISFALGASTAFAQRSAYTLTAGVDLLEINRADNRAALLEQSHLFRLEFRRRRSEGSVVDEQLVKSANLVPGVCLAIGSLVRRSVRDLPQAVGLLSRVLEPGEIRVGGLGSFDLFLCGFEEAARKFDVDRVPRDAPDAEERVPAVVSQLSCRFHVANLVREFAQPRVDLLDAFVEFSDHLLAPEADQRT